MAVNTSRLNSDSSVIDEYANDSSHEGVVHEIHGEDGRFHSFVGWANPNRLRKLEDEDVVAIKIAYARGFSKAELSRAFEVSTSTIDNIIDRYWWNHVWVLDTKTGRWH